jgi:glyoxylase-like metal-dependent hydrolase (beta-lactamase superfamily II)
VSPVESESFLAELGIHRIPCPVPFPQAGGPVNVYAIEEEGGGIALWDTGLVTEECERALLDGLAARGWSYRDVRRVFCSHGHLDHYGLARTIAEGSGAQVFIHPLDKDKAGGPGTHRQRDWYREYLLRCGLRVDQFQRLMESHAAAQQIARPIPDDAAPLQEGETLRFARFSGAVLHAPGHTPGEVVLHISDRRALLSGDHMLEKVSPNPLLELGPNGTKDKFRALVSYLESAERVRAMDLDWVLPGHGAPFADHRRVLDGLAAFYRKRQERIAAALQPGPRTPLELVHELFPKRRSGELYLMLSEVIANLEVMEREGRVAMEERDGLYRWSAITVGTSR